MFLEEFHQSVQFSTVKSLRCVRFSATPKEWAPGQTASLSVLRNGEKVAEVPCTIDGAVCTAAVDLPLEDALVNYTRDVLGNVITAAAYGEPAGRITIK